MVIKTAINNKAKPDFSEYYICQLFKSRHRRTALNKTTNKRYREVHYALYEYIYMIQFIIAILVTFFLAYKSEEGFPIYLMVSFVLLEVAFMLLFPLRYFFIRFEEIDINNFDSQYRPEYENKSDNNNGDTNIHIDGEY